MDNEFSEEDKTLIKEMIEFYKGFKMEWEMNSGLMWVVVAIIGISLLVWIANMAYEVMSNYNQLGAIVFAILILVVGIGSMASGAKLFKNVDVAEDSK